MRTRDQLAAAARKSNVCRAQRVQLYERASACARCDSRARSAAQPAYGFGHVPRALVVVDRADVEPAEGTRVGKGLEWRLRPRRGEEPRIEAVRNDRRAPAPAAHAGGDDLLGVLVEKDDAVG